MIDRIRKIRHVFLNDELCMSKEALIIYMPCRSSSVAIPRTPLREHSNVVERKKEVIKLIGHAKSFAPRSLHLIGANRS